MLILHNFGVILILRPDLHLLVLDEHGLLQAGTSTLLEEVLLSVALYLAAKQIGQRLLRDDLLLNGVQLLLGSTLVLVWNVHGNLLNNYKNREEI